MNLLTIVTDEGEIIGAIIDGPHEEMRPNIVEALKSHYDARHDAEVISIFIGQPNEAGDVCVNVDYRKNDEQEQDYAVITLTPAFLFTDKQVTAAQPVNGIDFALLDQQRAHLADIIVTTHADGQITLTEEQQTALDGIQGLLDHISDTHKEREEQGMSGNYITTEQHKLEMLTLTKKFSDVIIESQKIAIDELNNTINFFSAWKP